MLTLNNYSYIIDLHSTLMGHGSKSFISFCIIYPFQTDKNVTLIMTALLPFLGSYETIKSHNNVTARPVMALSNNEMTAPDERQTQCSLAGKKRLPVGV